MIRAGAGISGARGSREAAEGAVGDAMDMAGIGRADLVFLFVTSEHLEDWPRIARAARERSGGARVVGCTGYGVLTAEAEIEGETGAAALAIGGEGFAAAPFLAGGLGRDPLECGREAGRQTREGLGAAFRGEGPPAAVILPDSYNLRAGELFRGLHEELGEDAIIVGGGAAETGRLGRTFQFLDEEMKTDAVAGAVFPWSPTRFIGITQAYQPDGEPMAVTRAEENIIFEISGRPAYEVFAEAAGEALMQNPRAAAVHVFVGLPGDPDAVVLDHGNYIVRPVVGLDPGKGLIALPEKISVGQAITFTRRDGPRARADLETMLSKAKERFATENLADAADFALYFNCSGRGASLYGESGVDSAAIRREAPGLPVAGFFTGSEIAPIGTEDHLHQFSGVLMILGGDHPPMSQEDI